MSKKKLAIIEDDDTILSIYKMILESENYVVKTATNGRDGLTLVKKFKPDLILLDLMMPYISGAEMLRQMRESKWGKSLKVLVLTNVGRAETPEELAQYNIEDLLIKVSLSPNQLVEKVKQTIT